MQIRSVMDSFANRVTASTIQAFERARTNRPSSGVACGSAIRCGLKRLPCALLQSNWSYRHSDCTDQSICAAQFPANKDLALPNTQSAWICVKSWYRIMIRAADGAVESVVAARRGLPARACGSCRGRPWRARCSAPASSRINPPAPVERFRHRCPCPQPYICFGNFSLGLI